MDEKQNYDMASGNPEPGNEEEFDLAKLVPFAPLAEKFVENQSVHNERQHQIMEKRLEAHNLMQGRLFYLVVVVIVFFFTLSSALIFWKEDTSTGLLILTHVAALVAGALAGIGWSNKG